MFFPIGFYQSQAAAAGFPWTIRTSAADNNWRGVAYGGGVFVAVSDTGTGNIVMSTHYLPGLGHRTYDAGDEIPADAVPRPTIDVATQTISQTEHGYEILDISTEEVQTKQDLLDLRGVRVGTTEARLARIERLLSKALRF